jgi:hypothetical protein
VLVLVDADEVVTVLVIVTVAPVTFEMPDTFAVMVTFPPPDERLVGDAVKVTPDTEAPPPPPPPPPQPAVTNVIPRATHNRTTVGYTDLCINI